MRPCNRRGTVSLQMTADQLLSLAVNVVQNGWSLEDPRLDQAEDAEALRPMLAEVYEQVLLVNLATFARATTRRG